MHFYNKRAIRTTKENALGTLVHDMLMTEAQIDARIRGHEVQRLSVRPVIVSVW